MYIAISEKLKNDYLKSKEEETLLVNVRKSLKNKNNQIGNDLISFLNGVINDLKEYNSEKYNTIESINSNEDIKVDKRAKDKFHSLVIDNNDNVISELYFANSEKLGNTLVTQQIMPNLVSKLKENPNYLKDSGVEQIVYNTYDINSTGNSLRSIDVIMRTLLTLNINVIHMFKNNNEYLPYTDIHSMIGDLEKLKNSKNNDNYKGIYLEKNEYGLTDIEFRIDNMKGQDSKYYGFYLLGLIALSRPNFKFKITKDKKIVSPDRTIQNIVEIINGDFTSNIQEVTIQIDSENLAEGTGKNKLIYGAPGTGKSYELNINYKNYRRITFYSEYDYSQFVGGLKPVRDDNGKINYNFVAGPFTELLIDALNDKTKNYGIIIEELNRANPAATFGDIFQLLDRNDKGISEYPVFNRELAEYIDYKTNERYNFQQLGIRLPGNLDIFATMNPSDQGVFTVDSAFKRRWIQEYKPIDWNNNNISKEILHGFDKPWNHVGKCINEFLIKHLKVDEDMLLGHFFLKNKDFESGEKPEDKLIGYLWNDVARYHREVLFLDDYGTLSQILVSYSNKQQIFVDELHNKIQGV